jgi:hypothetical protein
LTFDARKLHAVRSSTCGAIGIGLRFAIAIVGNVAPALGVESASANATGLYVSTVDEMTSQFLKGSSRPSFRDRPRLKIDVARFLMLSSSPLQMVDHLWPTRTLNTSEERRRRQARYYEDLRAQIAASDTRPAGDRTISRQPLPIDPVSPQPQPQLQVRTQASQFVDSVLSPMTAPRSAAPSALSQSLPPMSAWAAQPALTFSVSPPFDPGSFDISAGPRLMSRSRPVAEYNRVRAVALGGAASVKSALAQGVWEPPIITATSPMQLSKVTTPAAGFSVRRGFAGRAAATQALPAESQLIYPDGRILE